MMVVHICLLADWHPLTLILMKKDPLVELGGDGSQEKARGRIRVYCDGQREIKRDPKGFQQTICAYYSFIGSAVDDTR